MTYLSMGQAAALVGWQGSRPGRRLMRFIVAKEAQMGKQIAIRRKAQRFVTEAILRHHCPELFDTKEEMAAQLRSIFRKQDAAISNIRNDVEDLREAMERMILLQRARDTKPLAPSFAQLRPAFEGWLGKGSDASRVRAGPRRQEPPRGQARRTGAGRTGTDPRRRPHRLDCRGVRDPPRYAAAVR